MTRKLTEALINSDDLPKIEDGYKKLVTEALVEMQAGANEAEMGVDNSDAAFENINESTMHGNTTNAIAKWNPILLGMVRRGTPHLIAFDVASVQPMSGPTGLAFTIHAQKGKDVRGGEELLWDKIDSGYSGDRVNTGGTDTSGLATITGTAGSEVADLQVGGGMTTAEAEALGSDAPGALAWNDVSVRQEQVLIEAKSRALKAEYTLESQQDMRALHNINIEDELMKVLTQEILNEQNMELIRTLNKQAVLGGVNTASRGIFNMDTDSDARWLGEKVQHLVYQLRKEAVQISKFSRRGTGNFCIVSADVAAALAAAKVLSYTARGDIGDIDPDFTSSTFAGTLGNGMRIYVDPYATVNYVTVGYKGSSVGDSGLFYCPYVPLQLLRATGEDTFNPKIGFKTRYAIASNPFVTEYDPALERKKQLAAPGTNVYYRKFRVDNV